MSAYTIKATRTTYNGVEYASGMEVRFAKLLDKYVKPQGIQYRSHIWIPIEYEGNVIWREIDFVVSRPIKIWWADLTQCFEIRGVLDMKCWQRMKMLKNLSIKHFIITEPLLQFYEEYGLLECKIGKMFEKKSFESTEVKINGIFQD